MKKKILSICIPTYNRSEILCETLKLLVENPEFNEEEIEIIVSDNCSKDNTEEIVSKYPCVLYYKNDKNESFYNLTTVMQYASASYIKLFNDTFRFKKGGLDFLLKTIRSHSNDNINLFFYPNVFKNINITKEIHSISSLIFECSFFSTWTASIGLWKNDFDIIINKNKYAEKHFPHLHWIFKTVNNNKQTKIYFNDLFQIVEPTNKGGYNVFKTFVKDYLEIIKSEDIKLKIYELEKFRLFKYFIHPWIVKLIIENNQKYVFETNGFIKIIFKKYWYEPYIYPYMLKILIANEKKNKNIY